MKEAKSIDRRIQKTKKLLWEALVELILKKGYDAVTVQDIIDQANVGRSTFYSHYENKEQLLFSGQPHLMGILFNEGLDFKAIYMHAQENKEVAKALLGKQSGDMLLKHIRDVIQYRLKQNLLPKEKSQDKNEKLMQSLRVSATAAALVDLLSNWIEQDMPVPIDVMENLSSDVLNKMLYLDDLSS